MNEVERAATHAAQVCCKVLIESLCDADRAHSSLKNSNCDRRDGYTLEQVIRFYDRYGGLL